MRRSTSGRLVLAALVAALGVVGAAACGDTAQSHTTVAATSSTGSNAPDRELFMGTVKPNHGTVGLVAKPYVLTGPGTKRYPEPAFFVYFRLKRHLPGHRPDGGVLINGEGGGTEEADAFARMPTHKPCYLASLIDERPADQGIFALAGQRAIVSVYAGRKDVVSRSVTLGPDITSAAARKPLRNAAAAKRLGCGTLRRPRP